MADPVHIRCARLPSQWISYPRLLLGRRPPVTEVKDPPVFKATVDGIRLKPGRIERYAEVCGFEGMPGVPSTFPHVLAMPLHLKIFALDAFPLRPMGLIHLSNVIELSGELRTDAKVDIEVSAHNYRETDAGLAFDMDTLISCQGQDVWRETCVFLSRWPESAQRPMGRPARPPKAPRDAAILEQLEATLGVVWSYARVSSDFNPIHLSDRAARYFGLRGAIAHGMWSFARSIAQNPQPTLGVGTRIETQFLTPVQLPAKVAIKEWTEDGRTRRAMCDVRTGRVHMYASWSS